MNTFVCEAKRERETHTSSDVVPIRVIWSKLLKCSSLNKISPFRQLDLLQNKEIKKENIRTLGPPPSNNVQYKVGA